MTTLEKFNSNYETIRMSRNSMILCKRQTGEQVYIHRNAYNALLSGAAEDWREVTRNIIHNGNNHQALKWVEVLTWVSI